MSNVVRTWKNEVNPAGEIELTDTELVAICGAWDDKDDRPSSDDGRKHHERFESSKREKFAFCFEEKVIKKEDND